MYSVWYKKMDPGTEEQTESPVIPRAGRPISWQLRTKVEIILEQR